MGVFIPNMEMPKSCNECRFAVDGWCYAYPKQANGDSLNKRERANFCPLVELPPHEQSCRTCVQDCQFIGCYMPNIVGCSGYIPAEEDET